VQKISAAGKAYATPIAEPYTHIISVTASTLGTKDSASLNAVSVAAINATRTTYKVAVLLDLFLAVSILYIIDLII
jgi:hypothetical protein